MEASPFLQIYVSSTLFLFAILWLCAVIYKYVHTALAIRWKSALLLYSCALTCICDLTLLVLHELQLREEGINRSRPSYFVAERLIQPRKRAVSPRRRDPHSVLLDFYDQPSGTLPYFNLFVFQLTVGSPLSSGTALITWGNRFGTGSFSFLQ